MDSPSVAPLLYQASLLGLPREIRDQIYSHYVHADGGYKYDLGTNKLKQADGNRIDLSLSRTCCQIASEIRGLALNMNRIHVSTCLLESIREKAGLFHGATSHTRHLRVNLFKFLAVRLFSPEMTEQLVAKYPQFAPEIRRWLTRDTRVAPLSQFFQWGEAPSLWDSLIQDALTLLMDHPRAIDELRTSGTGLFGSLDLSKLKENHSAPIEPWMVPEKEQVDEMVQKIEFESNWMELKFRFSAAATAIRFLRSLPATTRAEIRHMNLYEDRESVAEPQGHGRGLISFCQENPKLRIQRVVSLWYNALPIRPDQVHIYAGTQRHEQFIDRLQQEESLRAVDISKGLGRWIAEVYALPSLGMPEGSFTLIFDGNPTPERSAEVFKVAQRDAAWQEALDLSYARGLLPQPSWFERRTFQGYIWEAFPQALREICSGTSALVRCNFNLEPSESAEDLVERHSRWSPGTWKEQWKQHQQPNFQPAPPLPNWFMLRYKDIIPSTI